LRSAGQALAVRAEDHPGERAVEPRAGVPPEFLAGLGIPDLHLHVTLTLGQAWAVCDIATGQAPTGRADGYALVAAGVSLEGEEFLAALPIPDLHRAAPRGTGQAFAVGANGHVCDRGGPTLESQGLRDGLGIPDLHRFVIGSAGEVSAVRTEGYA